MKPVVLLTLHGVLVKGHFVGVPHRGLVVEPGLLGSLSGTKDSACQTHLGRGMPIHGLIKTSTK